MFGITTSIRSAARISTRSTLSRSFQSVSILHSNKSTPHPTSSTSASSQQHPDSSPSPTGPRESASENTFKSEEQDAKEAARAMGGIENMQGQYGGAAMQEGNATAESEEGKRNKEAAKQGEK